MKIALTLGLTLLAATLALAPLARPAAPAPAPENYKIDPSHSSVLFHVKHAGFSTVWGRFNEFSGDFVLDEKEPSKSSVLVEVRSESIDTNSADRDKHLRSPDFFNAKQFPTLGFKSIKVARGKGDAYDVEGELTLLGVTKPLKLSMHRVGAGEFPVDNSWRCGFDGSLTLARSDFGMKYGLPDMLGDEVTVELAFEGIRRGTK